MIIRRVMAMALIGSVTAPAHAVEFWHSNTVWAGQGVCSATFTFDSGLVGIRNLDVAVALVDGSGKDVVNDTLTVATFGGSGVDRYADAFIEGADVCDDTLSLVVKSASAIVDGKATDLVATRAISARDFKPFRIRVP